MRRVLFCLRHAPCAMRHHVQIGDIGRIKKARGKDDNPALFTQDARMAREIMTGNAWPGKRPLAADKNFRMLASCVASMAK